MNTLQTTDIKPSLSIINGQIKTNSLAISENFGKRHDNVLAAIRNSQCSNEFKNNNFKETFRDIDGPNGAVRKLPYYELTRDGFVFIVLGFTGKKAAIWKEAYIEAFNKIESVLLARKQQPKKYVMKLSGLCRSAINRKANAIAQMYAIETKIRIEDEVQEWLSKKGHNEHLIVRFIDEWKLDVDQAVSD